MTNYTYDFLVQSFVNALTNLSTMMSAKASADHTEEDMLNSLRNLGSSNGVYVTAQEIPEQMVDQLVKSSVNAHMSKVQSEQLEATVENEVQLLQKELEQHYVGKKVTITARDKSVFESIWFDPRSGDVSTTPYKRIALKGKIEELSLHHNVIVIKPGYFSRKLNANRVGFYVYVVDMNTLTPQITIH